MYEWGETFHMRENVSECDPESHIYRENNYKCLWFVQCRVQRTIICISMTWMKRGGGFVFKVCIWRSTWSLVIGVPLLNWIYGLGWFLGPLSSPKKFPLSYYYQLEEKIIDICKNQWDRPPYIWTVKRNYSLRTWASEDEFFGSVELE